MTHIRWSLILPRPRQCAAQLLATQDQSLRSTTTTTQRPRPVVVPDAVMHAAASGDKASPLIAAEHARRVTARSPPFRRWTGRECSSSSGFGATRRRYCGQPRGDGTALLVRASVRCSTSQRPPRHLCTACPFPLTAPVKPTCTQVTAGSKHK